MSTDHPLLATIRASIDATGTTTHHWGQLRREVFPGLTSWLGLKAWCAENAYDCELAYSQSSKGAVVQFRRQGKMSIRTDRLEPKS